MSAAIWTQAQIEAAQDRYLRDLETILRQSYPFGRKRLVLLSGGMDSFLIVAVLRHLMPSDALHTLTIQGTATDDLAGAEEVARFFGTDHEVCRVTVDDIVQNLAIIAGYGHKTLRPAMSHICFHICLERYGVMNCTVYSGQGADVLYGSRRAIYKDAVAPTANAGVSLDRPRTELKKSFYAGFDFSRHHLIDILGELGGQVLMPYADPRLAYLSAIPFSVIEPFEKRFVKAAVRRRYGFDVIADRERTSMQEGTGLYRALKERLKRDYPSLGNSAMTIIEKLSA